MQFQQPDPSFPRRSNDLKNQDSSNAISQEALALKQSGIGREIKPGCVLLPKASFLFVSGALYFPDSLAIESMKKLQSSEKRPGDLIGALLSYMHRYRTVFNYNRCDERVVMSIGPTNRYQRILIEAAPVFSPFRENASVASKALTYILQSGTIIIPESLAAESPIARRSLEWLEFVRILARAGSTESLKTTELLEEGVRLIASYLTDQSSRSSKATPCHTTSQTDPLAAIKSTMQSVELDTSEFSRRSLWFFQSDVTAITPSNTVGIESDLSALHTKRSLLFNELVHDAIVYFSRRNNRDASDILVNCCISAHQIRSQASKNAEVTLALL